MNKSDALNVTRASTLAECERFSGQWNDLVQQSTAHHIFATFEWIRCWWEVFGKEKQMYVMVIRDHEKIIGIAPLMISKRGLSSCFCRTLECIGQDSADYNSLILLRNREEEILAVLVDYLLSYVHEYDVWMLKGLADGATVVAIKTILSQRKVPFHETKSDYPFISLAGSFQAYLDKIPKKFKKQIMAYRKKIADHKTVELRYATDNKTAVLFWEKFMSLYRKRASKKRMYYDFLNKKNQFFLKCIQEQFLATKRLSFTALALDGAIVSIHFGFVYNERFYYYAPVFDDDCGGVSPGVVHLSYLVEDAFRDSSLKIFDLLRGAEWYKTRWTDKASRCYDMVVANRRGMKSLVLAMVRIKDVLVTVFGLGRLKDYLVFLQWSRENRKHE